MSRARGAQAERLAERYLKAQGFRILARNLHLGYAEIDLVALEQHTLCIVEVKYRRNADFGRPEESVGREKRRRLRRAAVELISTQALPRYRELRFDVVSIEGDQVRLIRDAFFA